MIGIDHKSWPQILDEFERSLEWHEEQLATAESGTASSWQTRGPTRRGRRRPTSWTRAQRLLERAGNRAGIMEKMASVSPNGTTIQRRRTHQTQHASSTFSTQL
ncbi:MAG: hypothetical protein R2710_12375 [Acidimicrobiales bacterium]